MTYCIARHNNTFQQLTRNTLCTTAFPLGSSFSMKRLLYVSHVNSLTCCNRRHDCSCSIHICIIIVNFRYSDTPTHFLYELLFRKSHTVIEFNVLFNHIHLVLGELCRTVQHLSGTIDMYDIIAHIHFVWGELGITS